MRINITVKDASPLINYAGPPGGVDDWGLSKDGDPCLSYYLNSSFHGTTTAGATATLDFNGTGIWIFGSKRFNHGNYTVTLDDVSSTYSGYGDDAGGTTPENHGTNPENCTPLFFQQPLFGASNLTMGQHTVAIENTGIDGEWLDVDYMMFEVAIGADSDTNVTSVVYDDADGHFSYGPQQSDWQTNTGMSDMSSYAFGTVHVAIDSQASAEFKFLGDAISVFGGVESEYGLYTSSMDSGYASGYNASNAWFYPGSLIYHANSLGEGTHSLALRNGNAKFDIDYAYVWSTGVNTGSGSSNSSGSSSGGSSSGSSSSRTSSSLSAGAIGGLAGGVVAALLITILILLFFVRRRRKEIQQRVYDEIDLNDEHTLPTPYSDGHTLPAPYLPSDGSLPSWNNPSQQASTVASSDNLLHQYGTSAHRERDAGPLAESEEEYMETLPPDYNQILRRSPSPPESESQEPVRSPPQQTKR